MSLNDNTFSVSSERLAPEDTGGPGPEEGGPITPSWERRAEIGFASALFKTIGEVLFNPVQTFRYMPVTDGLGGPLLYVVILGTVGSVFQAFYSIIGLGLETVVPTVPSLTEAEMRANALITLTMMILSPLLVVVGTFIGSAILHLFLLVFGGANRGFEATFRVIAYVGGATALLNLIPVCAAPILLLWSTVCEVIGAREAHRTTTWQSLLAVVTPWLLCCFCAFGLVTLMGVGLNLAAQAAR